MKRFEEKPQLEEEEICDLAKLLNVSEKRIKVWFWHMRWKRRRQGLLAEGEGCSALTENQSLYYIHYALVIFKQFQVFVNLYSHTLSYQFQEKYLVSMYT